MQYLYFVLLFVLLYLLPFLSVTFVYNMFIKSSEDLGLAGPVLACGTYFLVYILRMGLLIILGIINVKKIQKIPKIYKYNFLIFISLVIIDLLLFYIQDNLVQIDIFKRLGLMWYYALCSLTVSYLPILLIFKIHKLLVRGKKT